MNCNLVVWNYQNWQVLYVFYYLLSYIWCLIILSLRDNQFHNISLWCCTFKLARRWNEEKIKKWLTKKKKRGIIINFPQGVIWIKSLYFIPGMLYGMMWRISFCTHDLEFEVAFTVNSKAPPLFTVTEVQRNSRQWHATEQDFPELFLSLILAHTCQIGIMVCFSSQGGILCILH